MVPWDWRAEVLSGVHPSSREVEEREQDHALRRVLVGLNSRDWQIVKLRYFNGLTLQAIANHLGLALSTVKSREEAVLRRIRKRLRKNGIDAVIIGGGEGEL
jgi:RNA polymerase sigma factor (sigma-70 family)